MNQYAPTISSRIIYSIGDTHCCGRQIIDFIQRLKTRELVEDSNVQPAFILLGDLCDGFGEPQDWQPRQFVDDIIKRAARFPELQAALDDKRPLVNWHKFPNSKDGAPVGVITATQILENAGLENSGKDELMALYEATRAFETLALYRDLQRSAPDRFFVVLGNHDVDLLRGKSRYGRQQKHLLLGLLGFSPIEVTRHIQNGTPDFMAGHPFLAWLKERPHMILSQDTIYMHGGPTTSLGRRFAVESFQTWLDTLDSARACSWDHPAFEEHRSFLSPDSAENDWVAHPETIQNFLKAAGKKYLAVGHSPFLDFEKGKMLDLDAPELQIYFKTPAMLPPDGALIKHDTNLKRNGMLWACRHDCLLDAWLGINADTDTFCPLRGSAFSGGTSA